VDTQPKQGRKCVPPEVISPCPGFCRLPGGLSLRLCYLSGGQNPVPFGLTNDALVYSPSHLVLCFFRNVSVADALSLYGLAGFICILHFWPGHYPGLRGLQHHLLFLVTALYVHRAHHSCGAVYCVALPWLLMSTFYPKTLMHLELSLSSCK
jgi:hypothetical protein